MATKVHAAILRDAASRPLRMRAEHDAAASIFVMAGLRPGHPRLPRAMKKDADARDKRGHDGAKRPAPTHPEERALLGGSRRMATKVHAAILRDAASRPLRMRAEHDAAASIFVMAGLRPGHPRLPRTMKKDVDARDKRGHDGAKTLCPNSILYLGKIRHRAGS